MSKEEDKFIFDIEEPKEKFTIHLNISSNDRIILSAPFGAGKTYFLEKYFERNADFEVIHLFPVNYSVASNEDIFELIKYDILFELLGKDVEFDKSEFKKLDYLPLFLKERPFKTIDAFTPLISNIPKIGKSLYNIAENLKKLFQEFEKQFKNIEIDDKKSVIEYLTEFTKKKGNIYEEDFYTQLICQLVNHLKRDSEDKKPKKETVLIIDDLDRIDPEHIFRILNVLSVHMDIDGANNKFDFDKIILVFDQFNVRNIFKNRYGTNVDYTGYIDKFYSYKIFEFSNRLGLKKRLVELLNSIDVKDRDIDFSINNNLISVTVYIFEVLIDAHVLTTRRLLKVLNKELNYFTNDRVRKFPGISKSIMENDISVFLIAKLLLFIYQDWEVLLESVNKVTKSEYFGDNNQEHKMHDLIEQCLVVLDFEKHKFKKEDTHYGFIHSQSGLRLKYELKTLDMSNVYICEIKSSSDMNLRNPKIMLILYDTLEKIKNEKLIGFNL